MRHERLVEEIEILLDLVAKKTTSLADSVMEIDVREYSDPDLFQREKTALFRDYPQFVGPSCLLPDPGDCFSFDDTGVPILVVRRADGGLNAFVNTCSHRGAPLAECGRGSARRGGRLSCPYHGWTYDLDGALVGVPFGREGFPGLDRESLALRRLDVQEKHGMIFVMPNPDRSFDIEEVLGGIGERLCGFGFEDHHYLGCKRACTDLSWKLNMDTFHEFYHFEFLHPDTIAQMAHSNIAHYRQYDRNHSMSSPTLAISELRDMPRSAWRPRDYSSYVNYLFPNTVIFVVSDHFQTWRVYPVAPDRSVVYHSMFLPRRPDSEAARAEAEAYFQMIHDVAVNEDYALAERIQRGLRAGFERRVLVGRNEPGVQNMHRQIRQVLEL